MIVEMFPQYSDEWWAARNGIPTASVFSKIVTSTGKKAASWNAEAFHLAAEIEMGHHAETFTNEAMERGIALEAEARDAYQFITGNEVDEVGLIFKDAHRAWSCSPDGMGEGGLEIKCPLPHTQKEYQYRGKLPTKYAPQVWGSLWVADELPYWDFFSYHPEMKPFCVRVTRDDDGYRRYADALETYMPQFVDFVAEIVDKC